ncbi:MAG: CcoQ/FixQ family Cbb3-type cytochrome c oxidase assembly chaperone [Flavobacteriales bacterium]|nr:CcoQ/FixQ family Cbb3-type cytochrome c oxidase assembly chaperone [Flavobacteriales bacterium]MBK6754709.1 CcoQ/FixQ family Cbb3-type cytochrome c oxidase assembly chaperone [Flavobacteriales bacterium]MBK9074565.1 CcoQ/FixQ family Cbb3-type cytochrome c oxidase assembly chaperone [Flavobacteriales bacterium]
MLKFIKHHLDTIAGVGIYPVISFVIFFSFFLLMLFWLRRVGSAHVDHMAALPLSDEINTNDTAYHAH